MTDLRLDLAVRFAEDVRNLSELERLPAAQVLLATAELELDSKAIRARVDRLLGEAPLYQDESGDLLFCIVRQLVFTRYGMHEGSRRQFLRHWIENKLYRDRDTISKSFLMNLANENAQLLSSTLRERVGEWLLRHRSYENARSTAWTVYHLALLGHAAEARETAEKLLAARKGDGSWGHSVPWTTNTAFALIRSGVVARDELASSLDYVLKRVHRGFLDDVSFRAALVKLLYRMNELSGEHLTLIRARAIDPSGIFLSHSSHDHEFVRRLADDLAHHGIRVWVDDAEIRGGDNLFDRIASALSEMTYLGVVLSEHSVTSRWVSAEITMRFADDLGEHGVRVIPIILDGCYVKPELRVLKGVDFRAGYEPALQQLVAMLTAR